MTFTRQAARQMDETSVLLLQEQAAAGSAIAREMLGLLGEPEAAPAPEVHIRWRPVQKRGNGFYAVKYSGSENGSRTLCGAPATDADMDWAGTRFAKNLAYVTCEACKAARTEGHEH